MLRQLFFPGAAIVLAALALVSCGQAKSSDPESSVKPNIILMFSDELQFEDIGFSGGSIPTPRLDELAAGGMYFERAYTPAPMCTPSRYSLLSGRYPGRCSDPLFLSKNPETEAYCIGWNTHLEPSVQTIPRILSAAGYLTGMAGKWHLSHHDFSGIALAAGDDPADPAVDLILKEHQAQAAKKVCADGGFDVANSVMFGNFDGFPVHALRLHNYAWFNKGALDFIEQGAASGKPFFLYLAATSLHGPHHAEEFQRDYSYTPGGRIEGLNDFLPDLDVLAREIAGMSSPESHRHTGMRFLDHQAGLVMDKIEELGIGDNTIVIFLPDHNTEPGKSTCYEKGIRIPMVIHWPGKTKAGSRSSNMVQTIDLLPSILEMAGVQLPDGYIIDGKSLLPVIEQPEKPVREYIYSESGFTRSVSDGQYKYIAFRYPPRIIDGIEKGRYKKAPSHTEQSGGIATVNMHFYPSYWDADQLFDLEKDPYEQHNLAGDPAYLGKIAELQEVLREYLDDFQHPFDLSPQPMWLSDEFTALRQESMKQKPWDIDWYVRDWGEIIWPPEN